MERPSGATPGRFERGRRDDGSPDRCCVSVGRRRGSHGGRVGYGSAADSRAVSRRRRGVCAKDRKRKGDMRCGVRRAVGKEGREPKRGRFYRAEIRAGLVIPNWTHARLPWWAGLVWRCQSGPIRVRGGGGPIWIATAQDSLLMIALDENALSKKIISFLVEVN
jgi:hypothetical protein